MPKVKVTENHKRNFNDLKDSFEEGAEGILIAYDKKREEQVFLLGSIFKNELGKNEFVPHAELLDLSEDEAEDRYIFETDEEEFEKAIS
jgi:hypothetical protein